MLNWYEFRERKKGKIGAFANVYQLISVQLSIEVLFLPVL